MWSVRASFFDHLVAKCHALRIVLLEPLIGKMTEALEMMSSRSRSFSSAVHAVLLAFSYDFLRRHARFSGFAKLLEKRFDRQPCCAGILYECMRFLTGHYKVNAAEEFLSFGCFRTEHRLVSAYINRIINVRLVLRAWHPPRSRSGYIVSISTGPTRRQLRDNAAARSIVIGGEEACSVPAGRPAVLVRLWHL